MAQITLKGNPIHTVGELPKVGTQAPDFKLVKDDLSEKSLADYKGLKLVLNILCSMEGEEGISNRSYNAGLTEVRVSIIIIINIAQSLVPVCYPIVVQQDEFCHPNAFQYCCPSFRFVAGLVHAFQLCTTTYKRKRT